MSTSSVYTPPMGATSRLRLDDIFSRNVGARYRATPQPPAVVLASADEKRAMAVLQLTWDVDILKRVANGTLGEKASSFSGSEQPRCQNLWDSLITSLHQSFAAKDNDSDDIFALVDSDKKITKRLLPPGHRPLRHHEELLSISFGSTDDPEPLVAQFHECLKAIDASGAGALDDWAAKRQLLAALEPSFYKEVITPLCLDTELAKVPHEEIYTHVLEVW
ncbi:hypothetical protein CYMTET_10486 [Cymbomonas tetramitiformis]|uniref:Uncharacterized protein n=1 Tax=Cymbomonas tetramitiformis TaxID=36881 RepID=A0AAE0GPN9_9CHLO|nr:hypothetical protein CYMTET_10486 [Cymbomonas tetramitiformis]